MLYKGSLYEREERNGGIEKNTERDNLMIVAWSSEHGWPAGGSWSYDIYNGRPTSLVLNGIERGLRGFDREPIIILVGGGSFVG